MDKKIKEIEAFIFGHKIGTMIEDEGKIYFQYSTSFKTKGLEISPVKLSLSKTKTLYTNNDNEIYKGIPGVFFDSLPDSHGMQLMDRYFETKGVLSHEISLLQRLMFVGDRGIGAISFKPKEHDDSESTLKIIHVQDAYNQMRKIQQGTYTGSATELMNLIDSASPVGGARPKMMINYSASKKQFIYNSRELKEGFSRYIIKFDEFFNNESRDQTKLEYVYMKLAKECGIDTAEVKLLKEGNSSHILIKRFDRDDEDNKLHLSTASALLHKPVHLTRAVSYEDLFVLTNGLTRSKKDLHNMYIRMVFNILSINNDTHPKNFSFLMNQKGEWSLSPAYDITYSKGLGILNPIATIKGKYKNITLEDFLYIADKFNIPQKLAVETIKKVLIILNKFEQYAKQCGISHKNIYICKTEIENRCQEFKNKLKMSTIDDKVDIIKEAENYKKKQISFLDKS